jgi:stage IV sporulation protein FB
LAPESIDMREPMNWALPIFRLFGITVKLHVLYILVTLGVFLRVLTKQPDQWFDYAMTMIVMVFVIILCHEFGHCFAARRVNGEADEILIWPLGGLAFCKPPMQPGAHFLTTAGGPFVNLVFCLLAATALLVGGFAPPLNPFRVDTAYDPLLTNIHTAQTHASPAYHHLVKVGTNREATGAAYTILPNDQVLVGRSLNDKDGIMAEWASFPPLPVWANWTARFFWLNWVLMLVNVLIPAFPLDGGRFLQCFVWSRSDYERGTLVACTAGQVICFALILLSLWFNSAMLIALTVFIWYSCYVEARSLQPGGEEGFYDSNKGYLGFNDSDEESQDRSKSLAPARPGLIRRWLQARTARRIQREIEAQQADDARMDELLDKLHREGKQSLTMEEQNFLDRMAARYRHKADD